MKKNEYKNTPLMNQYYAIKSRYTDALLLFRVGDFYETLAEDAIKCSQILDIALTKRSNIDLAGFPYHSIDSYLPKLVRAGFRVAICDQLEESQSNSILKRDVTELVTPSLALNDQIFDSRTNNFLISLFWEREKGGAALLDISSGEFFILENSAKHVNELVKRFQPNEIIYPKKFKNIFNLVFGVGYRNYAMFDWVFEYNAAYEKLTCKFQTISLKGFGIENFPLAISAAGAVLQYLSDTEHNCIEHISSISQMEEEKYLWIDDFTLRNLEIVKSLNDKGLALINILDKTVSTIGARLLKRWILFPLKNISKIEERHNAVFEFLDKKNVSLRIFDQLKRISDVERLTFKISSKRITPREVIVLHKSLVAISTIKKILLKVKSSVFKILAEKLHSWIGFCDRIMKTLSSDPPYKINKGNFIAKGYSKELDYLRDLMSSSKDYLEKLILRERKRTGIGSLKISFNRIFGYYIEIRNAYKNKVPSRWLRKQTLANSERYISEELKEYEAKVLVAEKKIFYLEKEIFNELILHLSGYIKIMLENARNIACIDVFHSFSICSSENNYIRPVLDESFDLEIFKGRHPIIEKNLPIGKTYIANDIHLNRSDQQILMITGPNMSGKSAILRQTALIVLMSHIGSYVSAKSAKIGRIDKIFSRVGASDNISLGESTFMVEMNETANILNNFSDRSLIIFDEIGRGTSTYDGISIAWAVTEFLHQHVKRPKTLFATHYHELSEMSRFFNRIKNFNVSVKEIDGKVVFLYKLIQGESEHSYGIHVAKMAGVPIHIIQRATEILNFQFKFFQDQTLESIRENLLKIDLNLLTPVDALIKLNEFKKMIKMRE
ncbi:MAG TPA: DNA mismatch repair protein MutS [Candidatus Angelobacter sp.]|nr:DNA mismatch repair protein MutS [Candidatus Angelobacter sp.]